MVETSEKQYLGLLERIRDEGTHETNERTGVGTVGIFGPQCEYDLSEGFPLFTTKKIMLKSVIHELLWFVKGDTNIKYLVENGISIWSDWPALAYYAQEMGSVEKAGSALERDRQKYIGEFEKKILEDDDFAKEWGELGPVYGKQWRDFNGVDQLEELITNIREDPASRRLIVSSWNPPEIEEMTKKGLPPCHSLYQVGVKDDKLNLKLYQRSADMFLGVPFNVASYAILTHMIGKITGYDVGTFYHTFGDAHIYSNHLEQVEEQLSREPRALPTLKIKDRGQKELTDFEFEDFEFEGYDPHPFIKAPIAI